MSDTRSPRYIWLVLTLVCLAAQDPATGLTTAAALGSLAPSDAARALPIKLKGIATYYDRERRLLFLQDADDGVAARFASPKDNEDLWVNAGDVVEIEGTTVRSRFKPGVRAKTGHVTGNAKLPIAVDVDPSDPFEPRFENRLVRVTGWVPSVTMLGNRVSFTLVLGPGKDFDVLLNNSDSAKAKQLAGAWVELAGVFTLKADAAGQVNGTRLYVQSTDLIQTTKALPITPIANTRSLSGSQTPEPFRIRGTVMSHTLGQYLVVRDSSGSLRVPYPSLNYFNGGSIVEVFGFEVPQKHLLTLTNIMVKLVPSNSAGEEAPPAIITPTAANTNLSSLVKITQVRKLSPQEASRGYPVDVTAVITFFDLPSYMHFVQDESSGIYIDTSRLEGSIPFRAGQKIRIRGYTGPGDFAPIILCENITLLGEEDFPPADHVSFRKLMGGTFDSQWVNLKGVVRDQLLTTNSSNVALFAGDGVVRAVLPPVPEGLRGTNLVDASIEVQGVCRTLFDEHRRLQGVELLVPDWGQLKVHEAAPPEPFTLPVKAIADLFQFHIGAGDIHRVRLMGVVTYRSADGSFYLQDGSGAIQIQPRQAIAGLQVGALVDTAGFPVIVDKLAMLQEAMGHTEKDTATIEPADLKADSPLEDSLHGSLIRIEGQILGRFSHGAEELLTVQFGERTVDVTLDQETDSEQLDRLRPGSVARFTGVCLAQTDSAGNMQSFRLLLRSPADIVVMTQPSWWTAQRTLWALGGVAAVLLLALGWVGALRRQVQQRTKELHAEIEQHKRTELQLQSEIAERKKMESEVARTHDELLIASRQAGMAEVATSVLHNVGNVLNSVNVSCGVIAEKIRHSKLNNISRVAELVQSNAHALGHFLEQDPKGRQLPQYLVRLSDHLKTEQDALLTEVDSLRKNVEHIKGIVGMQQAYAKVFGSTEAVNVPELVEDALRMNSGALVRHEVRVVRDYQEALPPVIVDKHKVLQILVNLICNAKKACDESRFPERLLTVRVSAGAEQLNISVIDNGVGIAPENLTRIFNHGFTTRKDGHGFGLHSGALAAKEMGGTLLARSDGPGKGAEFTLALPLKAS